MSELLNEIGQKYNIKLNHNKTGFTQSDIKLAQRQVLRNVKEHIKAHYQKFSKTAEIDRHTLRQAYRSILTQLQSRQVHYRVLPIWMNPESQYTIRYLNPLAPEFKLSPRMLVIGSDDSFIYLTPFDSNDYLQTKWEPKIPFSYLILQEIQSVAEIIETRLRKIK